MENEMYELMVKCCKPLASSEAKLLTLPFAREFEHFSAPAPSQPDEVAVLSLPESSRSRNRHVLEEEVVHTPPQDHHRSLLSDQNSRVLEAELDDEPRAKRACVAAEVIVLSDSDDEERAVDAKGRGKRVEESSKSEGKGKIGVDSRQSPVDPKIRGKRVEESREREKGECSNDAKGSEEISPLLWLVDVLVKVFGIPPEDDDEKDIIKLAKKKGVVFPRPRWWPPPGVDDEHYPL